MISTRKLVLCSVRFLFAAALLGFLLGVGRAARLEAANAWERRYQEREWHERHPPTWVERVVYGVDP